MNFMGVEPFNQGWVCPKCGRVYSPTTPMCYYCGNGMTSNYTCRTGLIRENSSGNPTRMSKTSVSGGKDK